MKIRVLVTDDLAHRHQHGQEPTDEVMRKLDARNRVEIAMWAHETGRIKK